MASFVAPLLHSPTIPHGLVNARTGVVVANRLLTAFDSSSRRKGLLGRDSLDEGTAMLIAPSNAVHTFFMRFPIDIVFLARGGRVLKLRHAVPARRMTAALRAYAVAEMAAGTLQRSDVQPGDTLVVTPLHQV
jgi:uncharacterized membrane protein (UPF0127 family)